MQNRIEQYWQGEAARYSENIRREMEGFKKAAWQGLIAEYLPPGQELKILDIGTGHGFFAVILSEQGHKVTAIDCADKMLEEAKRNTQIAGYEVEFYKMDSHLLAFPDDYFDVVINRNLTWILYDPLTAYREWQRVLKPQGRLLIFDANWNLRLHDAQLQKQYEEDQAEAERLGIIRNDHVDPDECDNIAKDLFFSKILRPQWDAEALINIGFRRLWIDTNISDRIWDEEDKILNRSTPMFLICGEK